MGVALGFMAGWLVPKGAPAHEEHVHEEEAKAQVWTCSMHPQIKQDHPGLCPLCNMDLIPLTEAGAYEEVAVEGVLVMSKEAAALAGVQTTWVELADPVKELVLYGKIQADERRLRSQVAHVSGRIEKLHINFAGEAVRQGQTIATVYSPELLTACQELLEALRLKDTNPSLLPAAREKLRLWKLTDGQVAALEASGEATPLVDIVATVSGIVTSRKVAQGDYVNQGSVLFEVADLSAVWAVFDAYESDLPYLKAGDRVEYTVPALPGKRFPGRIAFIDPALDKSTRTVKVRVETPNSGMELKPEMYAEAHVHSALKQYAGKVVVPSSALLWTGKRSIVYVKDPFAETPAFELREVELGPSLGGSFVVLSGLEEGEEIVTSGAFLIDASAQLEGKRSMMNGD
jgi:Cu(I)/Ag(I) efflux system membrane fusion protein